MPRATRCPVPLLALCSALPGQSHVAYADFGHATLLQRLIAEPASATFEGLCKEIYGVPRAGKLPETDTLERRFLGWLATNSR